MFFHKTAAPAWIIVFLGNPGRQYDGTRHNAGFITADTLAEKKGISIDRLRFHALTAVCSFGQESVLLMKPQTYMNNSGDAVAEAMRFYKIPPERILVVSDEISLSPGQLRIRTSGSAGGHNGLKSIIARTGSQNFPRFRLGVGSPPHPDYDLADWVLGHFSTAERETVNACALRAADALECFVLQGADKAMSLYNR